MTRVIVVDDNPQDRLLAARALLAEFEDAEIVQVPDEPQLMVAIEQPHIDAVVTDFRLRWSDGLKVLALVHARDPEIPVVMFTNTGSEEVAASGLRKGLADYIIKGPTQYARLAHAVRHAIQRARAKAREAELFALEQAARRAAEEANRVKDEFLATVSHELRTPLNAIMGWLHTTRRRPDDAALREKAFEVIERNAQLLARVVEDLMDSSRILSGRLTLSPRAVNAREALESAIQSLRLAAETKRIAVDMDADPRAVCALVDPDRMQQVLWNLLSNAIKFTPAGGRVTTRLTLDGERVVIAIADTGEGIDTDYLPRVFDRFSQQNMGTTRAHMGLGLGLALARQLVEAHGGEITASSDGPGRGATFVVRLPAIGCESNHDGFRPGLSQQTR